jgi:hypothetical protein
VHDVGTVDRGQCGGDTDGQAVQVGRGQRATVQHDLGQARPVDEFDHQIGRFVVGIGVEHFGRAERRHFLRTRDLAAEPSAKLRLLGQIRTNDFERDRTALRRIRQINRSHTTFAEPP